MGSKIMVGNSSGWNSLGSSVEHANTGHASDMVGVDTPIGVIGLLVGDWFDVYTRPEKKFVNQGLNVGGAWVAHTLADCRIHVATGATLEIERNFEDEDGVWVVARYTRAS